MLENRLIAPYFPPAYYLAMTGIAFRDRARAAMKEKNWSKAELSRRSEVPYHALDKFLKGVSQTTAAENAVAIANALGIKVDDDREYEELRELFYQLDEGQRKFVIASVRGLASQD